MSAFAASSLTGRPPACRAANTRRRVGSSAGDNNVAIERCDDLAGNPKDVWVKEAKSELVKGKANAKAQFGKN